MNPPPHTWLADTVQRLLQAKYHGKVPGVRRISQDIAKANNGDTISHGHVHNILTGESENLTDRTRVLLARFLGEHPSALMQPVPAGDDDPLENGPAAVHALAARFATFEPAQLAAIRQAIEIVDRDNPR